MTTSFLPKITFITLLGEKKDYISWPYSQSPFSLGKNFVLKMLKPKPLSINTFLFRKLFLPQKNRNNDIFIVHCYQSFTLKISEMLNVKGKLDQRTNLVYKNK